MMHRQCFYLNLSFPLSLPPSLFPLFLTPSPLSHSLPPSSPLSQRPLSPPQTIPQIPTKPSKGPNYHTPTYLHPHKASSTCVQSHNYMRLSLLCKSYPWLFPHHKQYHKYLLNPPKVPIIAHPLISTPTTLHLHVSNHTTTCDRLYYVNLTLDFLRGSSIPIPKLAALIVLSDPGRSESESLQCIHTPHIMHAVYTLHINTCSTYITYKYMDYIHHINTCSIYITSHINICSTYITYKYVQYIHHITYKYAPSLTIIPYNWLAVKPVGPYSRRAH